MALKPINYTATSTSQVKLVRSGCNYFMRRLGWVDFHKAILNKT